MAREKSEPRKGAKGAEREADLDVSDVYSVEYLAEAAAGEARQERLAELKRRIALGAYKPDPDAIAEGMLARVNLADDAGEREEPG